MHQPARSLLYTVLIFLNIIALPSLAVSATLNYTYDSMHRIIRVEDENETVVDRTYDALGNRLTQTVSVSAVTNNPPYAPSNTSPENMGVDINPGGTVLNWSGGDPDPGNTVTYDVYLSESSSPHLVKSGLSATTFSTNPLKAQTTYYWQIIARDNLNAVEESPVWMFTTGNTPPLMVEEPLPATGSTIAYDNVYLRWNSSQDPDEGDSVTYDVYFGTSSELSSPVQSGSTDLIYNIGALESNTTYYWKIVVKDNHGASSDNETVWTFDTIDHEVQTLDNVTYSSDTTLTQAGGPYIVHGNLTVSEGAKLTIEAGTVLKMERVAQVIVNGTLDAQGEPENPIIFTSSMNDNYGGDTDLNGNTWLNPNLFWAGLHLMAGSDNTILDHCVVEYVRGGGYGAVRVYDSSPTITNSIIRHNPGDYGYGITVTSGSPTISDNIFNDNGNYDISIAGTSSGSITGNTFNNNITMPSTAAATLQDNTFNYNNAFPITVPADAVGTFTSSNEFNNLDVSSYLDVSGGTISKDATWQNAFRYHINGSITVQGTDGDDNITTLTIAEGAELGFSGYAFLNIGQYGPGALIAVGSPDNTILFTSDQVSQGAWYGIRFNNTTDDNTTRLEHCVIEYATTAVSVINSSPTITNSIIRHNSSYGIQISSGSPTISDNTFSNNGNYDISIAGTSSGSITGNL